MSRDEMRDYRAPFGELWRQNCPFCDIDRHHKNGSFLAETDDWYIIHNLAPYNGVVGHLIATTKAHLEQALDFERSQHEDFSNVLHYIQEYYKNQIFFQFTRETLCSTRTVGHFHAHFLPGEMVLFDQKMDWVYTPQDSIHSETSNMETQHRSEIIRSYKYHNTYAGWSDEAIRTHHIRQEWEKLDEGEYYEIIRENGFHKTDTNHVILFEKKKPETKTQQEAYLREQEEIYKSIQRYFHHRPLPEHLVNEPRNYFSFTKENIWTSKETHFLAGELHFDSKMKEFVWLHPGQKKPPLM